ncbi:methyltransferase [Pseudaquabacterium pictum]|uniref:O-methyltransferase n=1 Tax=Pseudaquabacterium pictum TaxID=2315236 RepID=A0A480AV23_9BURK|nr:methyltransferase [Rubrivivax pictus]GCL65374.1 O-methyltransferase [Rubrivivax pictus]
MATLPAVPGTPALDDAPPGLWTRWAEGLQRWADRQVASPAFRRWAARFPLTRPIARRRASQLFDLVAGFSYTQVLLACVQLKLFDRLAQGPASIETLAPALQLPPEGCRRLLDAAVALRLLARRQRRGHPAVYGLGPLGAPMVGNAAIAAMVEHHVLLYADLADPLAMLRATPGQGELARYWAYARSAQPHTLAREQVADYSVLMAASQPLVADEILDTYPLQRHQCLLDVGGGEGVFVAAAAQRWPHLKLMVFDLPEVARRAQGRLAALGLSDRATAVGGDFTTDALPAGADVISLVRVVHDHDDHRVMALLHAARRALPPHGVLLLAEPMAGTAGAQAMGDAYFGLYLWAMGSGRPRTIAQLGAMLQAAGFSAPRHLRNAMPLQTQVLVARPVAR